MLIPYNTDAPIYYFPFATIGLIVVNTLVFAGEIMLFDDPASLEVWMLQFDTINPLQWLTTNFLHADIGHLVGNMFFLWGFGLVVEGKLGWWRFLATYLAIGVVYGAVIQLGMFIVFRTDGAALGASGVIFGILAMAVVWAPKNDMNCFLWLGVFSRTIDVSVSTFGGFYLGIQILFFFLGGFQMSSEALHLTGLVLGSAVGVGMLKLDWVDCEGWDLFNVMKGREREAREESRLKALRQEATDEPPEKSAAEQRVMVRKLLVQALTEKQYKVAVSVYKNNETLLGRGEHLADNERLAVINAMHREAAWKESLPLMVQVLQRCPDRDVAVRLKLAQILIQKDERPQQAIAVLKKLPAALPEKQAAQRQQLVQLANGQIADGAVEFDIQDW